MARTKTSHGTARSAAHAAPDPGPAPGTAPAAGSPAAAVHAALAASPGSPVAAVADAAGTGKPAARAALLEMEQAGTATRIKGARPGIPDTWTLAEPAPDAAGPAADAKAGQAGQPGKDPGGSPDDAGADETARGTGQDRAAQAADPVPEDGESAAPAVPGPETAESGPRDGAPAEDAREDTVPGEQDDDAAPGSDPDDGDAPHDEGPGTSAAHVAAPDGSPGKPDTVTGQDQGGGEPDGDAGPGPGDSTAAGEDGSAGEPPDPALVAEITRRTEQIRAAASAAATALTCGDLRAALAGIDEIYDQVTQARRLLKAAAGGRGTPASRPGGLREKVLGHLRDHPGKEFTPHEIHKVLGNSSGAIANALDTLVKHGHAEVATEKPRKFRLAARTATAPAGADAGAGSKSELAGAA